MARARSREGVDGLRGVAHHAQLLTPAEPLVEHKLLERGNVLVFVHNEVLVLPPDLVAHLGVTADHVREQQQDVLEVEDHRVCLCLLIGAHRVGHLLRGEARGKGATRIGDAARVVVWVDERNLCPLDLAREVAHCEAVHAEADAVSGTANQLRLL